MVDCRAARHPRGEQIRVRVVFAAEPATERAIRCRIGLALAAGQMWSPDATSTRWQLRGTTPSDPTAEETGRATALLQVSAEVPGRVRRRYLSITPAPSGCTSTPTDQVGLRPRTSPASSTRVRTFGR